jgi:hypothetical protein
MDTADSKTRLIRSLRLDQPSIAGFLKALSLALVVACCSLGLLAQDFLNTHRLSDDWMYHSALTHRLQDLAGEAALNCGGVRVQRDPNHVTDCALRAYGSNKSFYARYDIQGIDTEHAIGLAFDGNKIYVVIWNHDDLRLSNRESLDIQACPLPTKLVKTASGRLNCFPINPDLTSSILWSYAEPY